MNLALAFANSVQAQPDKVALFWGADEFTYAALLQQSCDVSRHLTGKLGVRPGDRVALWLKNCPEFVTAVYGILHAGAVLVPINNFLKPDEVSYMLLDGAIDLIISDKSMSHATDKLVAARPALKVLFVEDFATFPKGDVIAPAPSAEDQLAVIIYTSGTCGKPKGAMLSHGNLLHNVESCRLVLETVQMDRFALLLPMFHSYMLTVGVFLPLIVGGSVVLVRSLHPVKNALLEMFQRRATILPAIPQFYRSMVTAPIEPPLPMRVCVSGAAPLPVQVLKDFEAKFQIPLIEGYGLSEASPVVTKNPIHGHRKPGSIGLPIANVEVSIQDDAGNLLPHHVVGEICVRGGNVMMGYWNRPHDTAQAMRNGWLLTGDVGYRDTEGYYFITDRKKDMLLVNGINVYPREIEEVIYQFGGVKEAAVIGVHDARKGEQPLAFVAPVEGHTLDEKELHKFLKARLAAYKVPRRISFMDALPRNATGKILKTTLRQMVESSGTA